MRVRKELRQTLRDGPGSILDLILVCRNCAYYGAYYGYDDCEDDDQQAAAKKKNGFHNIPPKRICNCVPYGTSLALLGITDSQNL